MHLSTVKVPIDFRNELHLHFHFQFQTCYFFQILSLLFICVGCIYLVRPSPVNAPHSTWHRTYTDSHARGQGRAMDRDTV